MTGQVHPQLRPILAQLSQMPRLCDTPLSELRGARKRPAVLPSLPVALAEDRSVPGSENDIPVRLYRNSDGVLPVIVLLHGGGFVSGGLDGYYDALCQQLCHLTGAAVVAVDYRLAPEHPFPAPAEDVHAVLGWLGDKGGTWDLDPARIALFGISAGGALAASATIGRNANGPSLTGMVLVYPVLDLPDSGHSSFTTFGSGYYLTDDDMRWFWQHYLARSEDGPHAAPLRAPSLESVAPTLILAADCDPLRDEALAFHNRLLTSGLKSDLLICEGMLHGFLAFPVERREHYLARTVHWLRQRFMAV